MTQQRIERIAFDIGGTFTDVIVLWSDGRIQTGKLLSLLDSVGGDMLRTFELEGLAVGNFVHGTTVATNALLEHKTAKVALITTAGFRDILEMRSQRRPNVYDIAWERSPPLVPRWDRFEVRERMRSDGSVETPLAPEAAAAAVDAALASKPEALALCLINSYVNGAHEVMLAEAVRRRDPAMPLSVSATDFAEMKEYERTSTTVVNAALMPVVDAYLGRLESQLGASGNDLQVMQSNGGLIGSAAARHRPVQIIESGPAAGVLAAARLAGEVGIDQALAFDMGGTTAKASLIRNGAPLEKPGGEVGAGVNMASRFFGGAGHAVQVPSLDIAEVGAGGGSIAWIDQGGALRVGPEGAGAQPGPVCYGRGGERPTVTDANVVLGYINPGGLAGATVAIDREAAAAAIERVIARPLGLSLLTAALGIVQVANATTMRALRAVSIERGIDPRQLSMIAFGGSGPIHAAPLAAVLGAACIYVPPFPGIFSAVGLLLAEYRHDGVRSLAMPIDALDAALLAERRDELEAQVRGAMAGARGIELTPLVDLRYRGQDKPLTLPLPAAEGTAELRSALQAAFDREHRAVYGYLRSEAPEIVALRLRGTASAGVGQSIAELAQAATPHARVVEAPRQRQACFDAKAGLVEVRVLQRADLGETPLAGPLIVEEWDTAAVVSPGWTARRDRLNNIVLERAKP